MLLCVFLCVCVSECIVLVCVFLYSYDTRLVCYCEDAQCVCLGYIICVSML